MAVTSRRVVLTGIGIVNPIGLDAASFWTGLHAGKSGIRLIQAFDSSKLTSRMGGEIEGFDPKNYLDKKDRKSLRVMARGIQLAVAGALLAMEDAKAKDQVDPTRFGVEFGAGLLPTELHEIGPASQVSANCLPGSVDMQRWGSQGITNIPPLWMLKYLPNMLACHVSILHNAQGPSNTVTEGDVASLLAIGEACRIIRRDQADLFLAGGADSRINPLSMVRQCLFSPLSRRNDEPDKACRPFDRDRDGAVIGEGAGVVVLEELRHAQQRGARIYAEVVGFASTYDRGRGGRGVARAIHLALNQAGIALGDLDHVNAHGVGSVDGDLWEARGLKEAFASCSRTIPVWATKGHFGNLGAGGGSSELAASLLAMQHGVVPKSQNYEVADPACAVPVTREPHQVNRPYFVKVGMTEMGQCAAVVCKKWE